MDFEELFAEHNENKLYGRYITNEHIEGLLEDLKQVFPVNILGHSVQSRPIYCIKAGNGKIKIFIFIIFKKMSK